jgi:alpha-glucosidase (family GH31 glycosyl hydrolase)
MRTHHGSKPNGNWVWWSDAETTEQFRRYAKLHMALVPYMEGLAKVASETGLPIWRGLALAYPEDAAVWPIKDQVLVGDGLLVAPVVTEGETKRDVYFPAGRFYPWDSGEPVVGPTTASIDAPLTEIPVFAAEGAVVPMFPDGVMTLVRESEAIPGPSAVGDDRHVLVFLGADGAFEEADGLSYVLTSDVFDPEGALSITFSEDGAQAEPLASCEPDGSVTPCFDVSGDAVLVFVEGPGVVAVNDAAGHEATFTTSGGWGRTVVRLRR